VPYDQIIALVDKYSSALRLAGESPEFAPQILAELEKEFSTLSGAEGGLNHLLELDGDRIRTALSHVLKKPDIFTSPYKLPNLDQLAIETPEILDALCSLPQIASVLGRAVIEPLLFHSYSRNNRLQYRAVGASVISTNISDASQAHIRALCAYSVLSGFHDSLHSPSVKEYLIDLEIKSLRVPVSGALQQRVSNALFCSLSQGIFIPEDYWSIADYRSRKEIAGHILDVETFGRKETWNLITSWFESQCAPLRAELINQGTKLVPYASYDESRIESLKNIFLDCCASLNQSLKMINFFVDAQKAQITSRGREILEQSLAKTCSEILKFYVAYPKPITIPRELILDGMNEALEHFTLFFDEAVPEFNDVIALNAFKHALLGFRNPDINSAILIRQLFPPDNDHLHSSRRFIIDDWIDQSQQLLLGCLTNFAENICTQIRQRSGLRDYRLRMKIDYLLDTFKRGVNLLVDMNTLKNNDIQAIRMLAPLVYRLTNYEQKDPSEPDISASEISPHFYGCIKAVELLKLMPDTTARKILCFLDQKWPGLSQIIASFIIHSNQDFSRDLVLLHGRDIQSPDALLSYNRALAAEKLYHLYSGFGKELPIPVTHELRRSFSPLELGLKLAKTREEISLPPEALPHVTISELKLLSYWVDDLLQSEATESRSGHLRRFLNDVLDNTIKIDSSLAWLLVIASDDYLQTEIPLLRREPSLYDKKDFEHVVIRAVLPLTFNLAHTPKSSLSTFLISISNFLALPQSAELFGKDTASQASQEILHYLQEQVFLVDKGFSIKELTGRPAVQRILSDIGYSDSNLS
jgi:hypothetical protein